MFNPFITFGLILLVVLIVSILVRILKQPLIIGYIISGIVVGPFFLNILQESEAIHLFSELGIAFLLFVVGLSLSPKVIKEVGVVSVATGLGQILFTSLIGYFIGIALGFTHTTALYIAMALTFSSTIIIMKLLLDKEALEKLYGKISIGFLLVQDIVVIFILIFISSLANGEGTTNVLFSTLIKGGILLAVLIPISYYILPKLEDFFAKSQEFLFLFAISWGLGLSLVFLFTGFTIEIGALVAGIMLSISPYSHEITSRLKPLRDFFIISFFIILGSQMVFADITNLIVPAVIFSIFILLGNPLIVMILMGLLGYSKKTGFMSGLTVAQISEFSLILIALGVRIGSLSQEILSLVTIVGLITIAGSTYMIIYSDKIFDKLAPLLSIFERKNIREKEIPKNKYKYILFGYDRIGFSILKSFSKITKKFLVVDYNPDVVKELKKKKIHAVYGDAEDSEFLENLAIKKASVIVSTIPDKNTNLLLLRVLKRNKAKSITILTSRNIKDAFELYDFGATYVILPHFLGGEYTAKLIEKLKSNKSAYLREKRKELKLLKERVKEGHNHFNCNPKKD